MSHTRPILLQLSCRKKNSCAFFVSNRLKTVFSRNIRLRLTNTPFSCSLLNTFSNEPNPPDTAFASSSQLCYFVWTAFSALSSLCIGPIPLGIPLLFSKLFLPHDEIVPRLQVRQVTSSQDTFYSVLPLQQLAKQSIWKTRQNPRTSSQQSMFFNKMKSNFFERWLSFFDKSVLFLFLTASCPLMYRWDLFLDGVRRTFSILLTLKFVLCCFVIVRDRVQLW